MSQSDFAGRPSAVGQFYRLEIQGEGVMVRHRHLHHTAAMRSDESVSLDLSTTPSSHYKHLSQWQLAASAAGSVGVQLSYAAQINLGTPHLLHLGISPLLVSIAWLAGPLSGLIVQPIVGYLSDRCKSPYGRRKPFILAGMLCTVLSLLLFAYCTSLIAIFAPGLRLAISDPVQGPRAPLILAIIAFFLLDFSIQVVQAPIRTLLIDTVHPVQRNAANAYLAAFIGVGNLAGGILASAQLSQKIPLFPSDVQAVFTITSALALASIIPTLVVVEDHSLEGELLGGDIDETASLESGNQTRSTLRMSPVQAFLNIPHPFWRVFTVQFCTWCGFFTIFVHITAWVGQDVFGGDGSAPVGSMTRDAFDRGVRLGGLGNAMNAVVTLIYALALPTLIKRTGILIPYAFSQAVEAACLLTAPFIHIPAANKSHQPSFLLRAVAVANISAFGIVWATTMTIPWTLVGDALQTHSYYARRAGLFTTIFNASQSLPQLIVAIASPAILRICRGDPAYVMAVAGAVAVVGGVLVVLLRVDVIHHRERTPGWITNATMTTSNSIKKEKRATSVGSEDRLVKSYE